MPELVKINEIKQEEAILFFISVPNPLHYARCVGPSYVQFLSFIELVGGSISAKYILVQIMGCVVGGMVYVTLGKILATH